MPNPTMPERLAPNRESWRPQREPRALSPWVRRVAVVAAGALLAGGLVAGVVSLLGHSSRTVPLIEADSRPLRVKPSDPGGMQVAGAEDQIMDGADAGRAEIMAPAPEAPAPEALAAQIQASHPAPPPEVPAAPAAVPMPAAPLPMTAAPAPPLPVASPAPAHPAVAAARPKPSEGKTQVQLAAMNSEEGAMAEWQRLAKKMPDLLGSHHPAIVQTVKDGTTYYRLRIGGFPDVTAANVFCVEVRAKGGACAVASF